MTSLPTVAVAIPAYNEAGGIAGFIRELDEVLAELADQHTFVVVDDKSTDATAEVAEGVHAEAVGSIEVIRAEANRGHGPSVVAAYRRCIELGTEVVVQVDGDGQFLADDLRLLFGEYHSGADVVTGSRVTRADPFHRKVISAGLRWTLRLSFGVRRRDSNCPFRLYRSSLLTNLLDELPEEPLVPHVELTVLESNAGVVVSEVDVRHRSRRGGGAGTMWSGRGRLPAMARLARFCAKALIEVLNFRRTTRR